MEYEEARRRKLEEFQKNRLEEQAAAEAETKLDLAVRNLLTEEARQRLNNVRLVNRQLYLKAVQVILYLAKAGQLQGRLGEEELKALLEKVRDKKEIKIRRK